VASGKFFFSKYENKVVGAGIHEFSNFQLILRFFPVSGDITLLKKII